MQWPFVSRKKFDNMRIAAETQLGITKYYQSLYAQAISTQDVLNAMLKEATSYAKDEELYVECSNCRNHVRVHAGNDNSPT